MKAGVMPPVGSLVRRSLREARRSTVRYRVPAVGEICIVNVLAFNEGLVEGKDRPGVVIAPFRAQANHWKVMGLTSKRQFNNGAPRKPLLDYEKYGLSRQSCLWSPRLPILPQSDIKRRIAVITPKDAMQIIRYCNLTDYEAECLIKAARAAHL